MAKATQHGIALAGLTTGHPQVWGAVRVVPLLRDEPITDLRLHADLYGRDDLSVVSVGPRTSYIAFIPHAFVATWSADHTPVAAFGTQLRDPAARRGGGPDGIRLHFHRRKAQRVAKRNDPDRPDRTQRLRFLPLHLALDGYLALHFGGPAIAWQEWTRRAVVQGLSPRVEAAYVGTSVPGLEDALRVFEIHPDQCGSMIYVGDALAAAFVVPHPADYRVLHPTLLQDLYGDLLFHYAHMFPSVPDFLPRLDGARVETVADLRSQLAGVHQDWADFHHVMAGGLLNHPVVATPVYRMGRFTLSRFTPTFDPTGENHIGETIVDSDGRLAYLKTFRLSAAQTRRGHLLAQLAAHDWNLDRTANAFGADRRELVRRLDRAGFGDLLRPDIIDHVRNHSRAGPRPHRDPQPPHDRGK